MSYGSEFFQIHVLPPRSLLGCIKPLADESDTLKRNIRTPKRGISGSLKEYSESIKGEFCGAIKRNHQTP